MEIAALKEAMREGGAVEREDADAWTAWPWKPTFAGGKRSGPPAASPPKAAS